ncbi:MAG: ABC transporter permease [Bacteroidales bacterium]|jgi:ABC-2 type transport system permease protein|nr:ABC transporter permease [Bacteroidales bacterium]
MKQLRSFIAKEFKHIFRDVPTMLILFIMPVAMMFLFGYALSNDIKHSSYGIVDMSHDSFSRDFMHKVENSEFFRLHKEYASISEVMSAFRKGEIQVAVIIPANFKQDMLHLNRSALQIYADASNPNMAQQLVSYLGSFCNQALAQSKEFSAQSQSSDLVRMHLLYNPQMNSSYSMVPAVMGLILALVCAMMTSVSIVREKERGTMELLLASPIKTIYIIIAKLSPYFMLSCINFVTILIVGHFVMGVPVNGSLFWIAALGLIYIIVSLSFGLLVSTVVQSQLAALLISGMVFMMPSMILSGMMFPLENMPLLLQFISVITPARWFIGTMSKLMIMGVEVKYILKEMGVLLIMATGLIIISLKNFKQRL